MQKERHVGADATRNLIQRRISAVDAPQLSQGNDNRRGIRRGAAQAGAQRDALLNRHAHVCLAPEMIGHGDGGAVGSILLHGKI